MQGEEVCPGPIGKQKSIYKIHYILYHTQLFNYMLHMYILYIAGYVASYIVI